MNPLERKGKKKKKIGTILISVLILLIGITSIVLTVIANTVISSMADLRVERNQAVLEDYGLIGHQITVHSHDGLAINAYVVPRANPRGHVLILHGMHGMDATSLFGYARFLYDLGFSPTLVDMRAHGRSEGDRIGFGYTEVWDVQAVIGYLRNENAASDLPIILYGLSMGGSTAINVAARSNDVDGIIAISPYRSIQAQFTDYMGEQGAPGLVTTLFEPFVSLALWFRYRMNPIQQSPIARVQQLENIPVFIVHGIQDTQTRVEHSQILFDLCSSNQKELWMVEGADHLIVGNILSEHSQFYRSRIANFLDAHF